MNTLNTSRDSNIHPVIDQQWHIISPSNFVQLLGRFDLDCCITGLISVLDNGYSWLDISGEAMPERGIVC